MSRGALYHRLAKVAKDQTRSGQRAITAQQRGREDGDERMRRDLRSGRHKRRNFQRRTSRLQRHPHLGDLDLVFQAPRHSVGVVPASSALIDLCGENHALAGTDVALRRIGKPGPCGHGRSRVRAFRLYSCSSSLSSSSVNERGCYSSCCIANHAASSLLSRRSRPFGGPSCYFFVGKGIVQWKINCVQRGIWR